MTKEEAKEIFLNRGFVNGVFDGDKWRQSVAVISKWLEQEPCEGRMKYVQETVNTIMDSCKTDSIKDKCFRNAARFIQNAIDGSSPEFELINDADKWIPVSERLPEPFSFVNCTCHSLIDDREDWVVETFYFPLPPDSPYSDWGNIPMLNWGECEVIAWMYRDIPKPYKAEKE